jgi:hypothetical protein
MLAVNACAPTSTTPVQLEAQRNRSYGVQVLSWTSAVLVAFVVPLALVLATIFVSSYGVPLPIEVRVP